MGHQRRRTPYRSKSGSMETSTRFLDCACAMSSLSNGSRWRPGSDPRARGLVDRDGQLLEALVSYLGGNIKGDILGLRELAQAMLGGELPSRRRTYQDVVLFICDGYATIMRRLCGTLATIMRQLRDTRFVASRVGPNRTGAAIFRRTVANCRKMLDSGGSSEPVPAKGAWRSLYEHAAVRVRQERRLAWGLAVARPLHLNASSQPSFPPSSALHHPQPNSEEHLTTRESFLYTSTEVSVAKD